MRKSLKKTATGLLSCRDESDCIWMAGDFLFPGLVRCAGNLPSDLWQWAYVKKYFNCTR